MPWRCIHGLGSLRDSCRTSQNQTYPTSCFRVGAVSPGLSRTSTMMEATDEGDGKAEHGEAVARFMVGGMTCSDGCRDLVWWVA